MRRETSRNAPDGCRGLLSGHLCVSQEGPGRGRTWEAQGGSGSSDLGWTSQCEETTAFGEGAVSEEGLEREEESWGK